MIRISLHAVSGSDRREPSHNGWAASEGVEGQGRRAVYYYHITYDYELVYGRIR